MYIYHITSVPNFLLFPLFVSSIQRLSSNIKNCLNILGAFKEPWQRKFLVFPSYVLFEN